MIYQKVQLDYWGLSYKQNLEKTFEIENNSRKVKIYNLSSNKLVYPLYQKISIVIESK